MSDLAWILASVIVIAATALPFVRWNDWWIRWFDFPRLQLVVIGLVLIAWQLFGGLRMSSPRAVVLAALVVCSGYQAFRIWPYTPFAGPQAKRSVANENGATVRLVTANVLMHNRQAEKYLRVLAEADADIILTTEADQWWTDQLKPLDRSYPYQVKYPLDNTYGMLLHSRIPLVDAAVEFLVEPFVPSIHSGVRLSSGHVFRFIGLHPRPPGPTENEESTERDAELIITARAVKKSPLPVVVLGDLNDVAWSHTTSLFQKISGLLDPRVGRGMYNTFHADYFFIRFPLDHVFHSAHFKLVDMRRLAHIGSDHFPIYVALSFTPEKDAAEQPPAAEPEEQEEAQETVKEAFEKKP